MGNHNKYYNEKCRNGWDPVIPCNCYDKPTESQEERIDYTKEKSPNYYIGRRYKYEARKVIEDFDLSYNSGVAVSYLLRAGKKKENSMSNIEKHKEDIVKAINHLEFELDRLRGL